MQAQMWTLPNAVTAYRILAGPLCFFLLAYQGHQGAIVAFPLMVLAEVSDFLDGYLARSSRQVSNVGKVLDPMADSLYRGAVFVAFAVAGWMPVWMLGVIVLRDVAVSWLRELAESRGVTLAARASGKWKAGVQAAAQLPIVLMVALGLSLHAEPMATFSLVLLLAATVVTAYSLFDYAQSVLGAP
jgi:CDP-diacylglycerol--glycerol-3-phosphate 3-phosphatidyltransferase